MLTNSHISRLSLRVSYVLCFLVMAVCVSPVVMDFRPEGRMFIPSLAMPFLGVFLWQAFTVYHHRRTWLPWLIVVVYSLMVVTFTLDAINVL